MHVTAYLSARPQTPIRDGWRVNYYNDQATALVAERSTRPLRIEAIIHGLVNGLAPSVSFVEADAIV